MTETKSLTDRIASASRKVGGALKADSKNKEQGYDYISADKILTIAGQALAEEGVIVLPSIASSEVSQFDRAQTGAKGFRYDAVVNFLFTVACSGESMTASWYGRGSDYTVPDKALYKAITSGHKYFIAKLMNIGEGNEDSEHETPDEQPVRQAARPSPKPATPSNNGNSMDYDTACAFTNSDGEKYGDLQTDVLANHGA